MEPNTNTYKLEQGGKVFLFATSIVDDKIRLACKNISSSKNKKFYRDFSIDQLRKLDKLFHVLKTPFQAIKYIDEALRQQKVAVSEDDKGIMITFYITKNGITNQIDIPLGNFTDSTSNGNMLENYENNNYEQYLQNAEYTQGNNVVESNNYDYNQYTANDGQIGTNDNLYITGQETQTNELDMNKYFNDNKTTYETRPHITPADDDTTNYYTQYQNLGNASDLNNDFSTVKELNIQNANDTSNFNEQIKQILEQNNNDVNSNLITTQAEEKEINRESKPLTTTKVLPVKTTTRVLPPIGPFTNLEGLDLHKLGMMNSEHQKMPTFEQMIQSEMNKPSVETNANYYEYNNQITTQPEIITTGETKTTITTNTANDYNLNTENLYQTDNTNIEIPQGQITENQYQLLENMKSENIYLKQQIKELRKSHSQAQNMKISQNELAELESLRKKTAELEILKGQLKELNSLRMEVAEYHSIKGQLKEFALIKEKLKIQSQEIAQLKLKVSENEKLKLRIAELESIKSRYEQDIQGLKESLRLYSIKTQAKEEKEEKEAIEDETPEEITVKGDIIHDVNELELITKKINKHNQKLTLNLLYKATADSDKAEAFHAKCDEAKSSIVLIETKKGKRFGGFTTCSWSGDCIDKKDEEAFVFSLDKMKTYDVIPGEEAIGCYPKFGPVFLGCQIRIYDKAFLKGGSTFERGLNFDTDEDYELNGGERQFIVKEMEVYEVVFE